MWRSHCKDQSHIGAGGKLRIFQNPPDRWSTRCTSLPKGFKSNYPPPTHAAPGAAAESPAARNEADSPSVSMVLMTASGTHFLITSQPQNSVGSMEIIWIDNTGPWEPFLRHAQDGTATTCLARHAVVFPSPCSRPFPSDQPTTAGKRPLLHEPKWLGVSEEHDAPVASS